MKEYKFKGYVSAEEKETLLRFDYADSCWYMDSSVSTHFNKALKQGWEVISKTINEGGLIVAMQLKAPANAITIRNAKSLGTRKQNLTDEQKKEIAERLKKSRER